MDVSIEGCDQNKNNDIREQEPQGIDGSNCTAKIKSLIVELGRDMLIMQNLPPMTKFRQFV
jgi:hypothetical protein